MKLSLSWILDYLSTMAHRLAKKNERNASSLIMDLGPIEETETEMRHDSTLLLIPTGDFVDGRS